MKEYLKNQIKNLPFIVIVFVLLYGITTFATSYLFDSSRVKFDTTGTDITAGDVQGAIGELYTAANNFTTYDTRLQGVESTIGSGTLTTSSQNLIGAVNGLNDQIGTQSGDISNIKAKTNRIFGFAGQAGSTVDTGISVNGGYTGKTLLIISSCHTSDGDATSSFVHLVRCGYSKGYYSVTEIAKIQVGGSVTISKNANNNITISSTGAWQATVIASKSD